MQKDDIQTALRRYLTPHDKLDERTFDKDGKMHPELRKHLLYIADFIISKTFATIPGLKVKDVYLNGSSAGYFYRERSDLDMRIEIQNENCRFLSNDPEISRRFLKAMRYGSFAYTQFGVDGRFVDVTITNQRFEIVGLYSILNDKWVIEPRKDLAEGLEFEEILAEYTKRYCEIREYIHHAHISGQLNNLQGIEDVDEYRSQTIAKSYNSFREFIIYKLLRYSGILSDLQQVFNTALKNYLTLK